VDPASRSLSIPIRSPPVTIDYKKTHATATALRRVSHMPSSPPRLLLAFLSTAAAPTQLLPPRRARPHPPGCCYRCRLHRGHRSLGAPRAPYRWGQHSRPPAAVLLLHRDRTDGSRCAVLCPHGFQVLLKVHVASICF
jgi:hypothetical protein